MERAGTLNLSVGSPPHQVVVELQQRLEREIQERETESALYNAKLYETEQKESDWYVGLSVFASNASQVMAVAFVGCRAGVPNFQGLLRLHLCGQLSPLRTRVIILSIT